MKPMKEVEVEFRIHWKSTFSRPHAEQIESYQSDLGWLALSCNVVCPHNGAQGPMLYLISNKFRAQVSKVP